MFRPLCFLELLAGKLSELHDVIRDVPVVIMLLFSEHYCFYTVGVGLLDTDWLSLAVRLGVTTTAAIERSLTSLRASSLQTNARGIL